MDMVIRLILAQEYMVFNQIHLLKIDEVNYIIYIEGKENFN